MMSNAPSDDILEFPQAFPIKVVGEATDDFDAHVRGLLAPFVAKERVLDVSKADSRTGRYVSLTVTITATSREQLDGIYQALSDSPRVLFSL